MIKQEIKLKNYTFAVTQLEKLSQQYPNKIEAHLYLGDLYLNQLYNSNLSIQAFEKALILTESPEELTFIYSKTGMAYASLEKFSEANINYEKGLKLAPQNDTLLYLLAELNTFNTVNFEKGLKYYQKLEDLNSSFRNNAEFNLGMAICYVGNNETNKAIDQLTTAIKTEPLNGKYYYFRHHLYLNDSDTLPACIDLLKAVELKYPITEEETSICIHQ